MDPLVGSIRTFPLRTVAEGPFQRYLDRARAEVNERVALLLGPVSQGVPEVAARHLLKGKRLRGGTLLMVFDALSGGTGDRSAALDLAAAVEIVHGLSLVLDDMLDGDTERRADTAVHVALGAPRALLEVVGLLALPYALAAARGPAFAADLARTHARVVESARKEFEAVAEPSWADYEALVAGKTGELFALAARFGAASAAADPTVVDLAEEYGRRTGVAVQIADDLADLDPWGTGLPGRSEAVLASCLGPENVLVGGRRVLGESVEAARRAARALLAARPAAAPACLLSAPGEMAAMMLR